MVLSETAGPYEVTLPLSTEARRSRVRRAFDKFVSLRHASVNYIRNGSKRLVLFKDNKELIIEPDWDVVQDDARFKVTFIGLSPYNIGIQQGAPCIILREQTVAKTAEIVKAWYAA